MSSYLSKNQAARKAKTKSKQQNHMALFCITLHTVIVFPRLPACSHPWTQMMPVYLVTLKRVEVLGPDLTCM